MVEALPAQREQLAWAKSIAHVEFEQDSVLGVDDLKSHTKLVPGQSGCIALPQLRWGFDSRRRILHQEVLIHRFLENVLQIRAHLEHRVSHAVPRKLVHVQLQREAIEVCERNFR